MEEKVAPVAASALMSLPCENHISTAKPSSSILRTRSSNGRSRNIISAQTASGNAGSGDGARFSGLLIVSRRPPIGSVVPSARTRYPAVRAQLPRSPGTSETCFQELQALSDVLAGSFALRGLRLDHGVLLQHVPAPVASAFEPVYDRPDVDVAVAQGPERPPLRRLLEAQFSIGEPLGHLHVHVLQVNVVHPVACQLRDLDGVASTYHEVASIQTQPHFRALQKAPELVVALDHGAEMVVQGGRDFVPSADLRDR